MTTPTLDEWRAQGRTYQHHRNEIFYRDEGTGEVLLCIHGFPTASWDWHAVWPELTARFRVIAPDMIGFGFSGKPVDYVYSIADQADLIEGLLASLHVSRAHVLAHDYGDTVAQELLARFHSRRATRAHGFEIHTVCLLNGGLFPETHRPRLVQELLAGPLGPTVARMLGPLGFRRSFSAVFGPKTKPSKDELKDFWQLIKHNDGTRVFPRLIGYMEERRQHRERWVGALQHTSPRIRLINGPVDPVSGAHMVKRYKELVPHPDVVLLEGIGHYPQVEDPQGTLKAFLEFVDH